MSELAPEMKAYLTVEEQESFCAKISEVIGIARMHVSIRHSGMERWDLQEKIRFENWFGAIDVLPISVVRGKKSLHFSLLRMFFMLHSPIFILFGPMPCPHARSSEYPRHRGNLQFPLGASIGALIPLRGAQQQRQRRRLCHGGGMRRPGILLSAIFVGTAHGACPKGTDHDVYFEKNSSILRSSEIHRLANWNIENALRFPRQGILIIVGNAEGIEKNAKNLSRERAEIVADYFRRTNYTEAEIIVKNLVYEQRPGRYGGSFTRTELEMAPPCVR